MFLRISENGGSGFEVVRIEKVDVESRDFGSSNSTGILTLTRALSSTTKFTVSTDDYIDMIYPTRIFNFGNRGTDIISIDNSNIYIKKTQEIITTDEFGTIISGSTLTAYTIQSE